MRWNPKTPGQNQYASDIHWADNIAKIMKKYYEQFGIKKDKIRKRLLHLNIEREEYLLVREQHTLFIVANISLGYSIL